MRAFATSSSGCAYRGTASTLGSSTRPINGSSMRGPSCSGIRVTRWRSLLSGFFAETLRFCEGEPIDGEYTPGHEPPAGGQPATSRDATRREDVRAIAYAVIDHFCDEDRWPAEDTEAQRGMLDGRVLDEAIDAWVWIDHDLLQRDRVEYHAESVANFITQEVLESALTRVVRRHRLQGDRLAPAPAAGLDADDVKAELGK